MAHKHSVYDSDAHFKIDGATRAVKNVSETKTMLVQYDHNSERFTFEVPRTVEGHDLLKCNRVLVHYINIDKLTRKENKGTYEVIDLQVSPEDDQVVICSWLISNNATQYVGVLQFVVQFACTEGDDVVYSWNTARHIGVSVTDGINNSDVIAEEYADILQEWYVKLFEMKGGNIDYNSKEPVKFWLGTQEEIENLIETEEIIPDCVYIAEDDTTLDDLKSGAIVVGKALQADKATQDDQGHSLSDIYEKVKNSPEAHRALFTNNEGDYSENVKLPNRLICEYSIIAVECLDSAREIVYLTRSDDKTFVAWQPHTIGESFTYWEFTVDSTNLVYLKSATRGFNGENIQSSHLVKIIKITGMV